MSALISNILPFILALIAFSILVTVHELGHFLLAKKNGVFVEEFAIGMGPLLFGHQFGETFYSVRALPLGGYCRMMGEDEDNKSEGAFNSKGLLARASILAAGPMMNFILALVIIFTVISTGSFAKPVVTSFTPGFPAESSGMQVGDQVVKVNGQRILTPLDLQWAMYGNGDKEMEVVVKRNGENLSFSIAPQLSKETGSYLMGFVQQVKTGVFAPEVDGYEKAGFLETIAASFFTMCSYIKSTVMGFIRILTFNISADELSGPIGIIQMMGESYEAGLQSSIMAALLNVASFAALLSANLGVLNLFPIPAMDGGRLAFLLIEAVRGKPISAEKEGMVHFVGFVLLMAFMVFIAYHDVARLFTGV